MIDSIIVEYLKGHRRLVIPKLGTFFVKESDGEVLFSELMRGDDGTLRGLVKARGVGDIEAAGVIDRFVFEVRHSLDQGRGYSIAGLGSFERGERGAIVFRWKDAPDGGKVVVPRTAAARQEPSPARGVPVSAAVDSGRQASIPDVRSEAPRIRIRKPRRRSSNMFLVVAVITVLAAVAVMVYGYKRAHEQEGLTLHEMFMPQRQGAEAPRAEIEVPAAAENGTDTSDDAV